MKKIYALIVVCLLFTLHSQAQSFYWIGGANGEWNNPAHWSLSQGGSAAADYPKDAADNAIFPANATVMLNASFDLNSLSVAASANVVITGGGATDRTITLHSTSAALPALRIETGSKLEITAQTDTWLRIIFGENAIGEIDGEWVLGGDIDDNAFASFDLGVEGFNTRININSGGILTVNPKAFIEPNETTGDEYLVFRNGSKLKLLADGPAVPAADYDPGSTIEITGITTSSVTFEEADAVGTITYNSPAQANGANHLYLSLLGFDVKGDLNILNTNNNDLTLISFNSTMGLDTRSATIEGQLNVEGPSAVVVAQNDGLEFFNNLQVKGHFNMAGTRFNLHKGNFISSRATTLFVGGNIAHNAGTISTLSPAVNETNHLYVIEMNGAGVQNIFSHSGSFDNASHQVTLRINNAAGVTLSSNLAVGRLSFNSTNKGVLSTNAFSLSINNATAPSVSTLPLEASSSTGFVNGNLQRAVATTEPVVFPVGVSGMYRPLTVIPSSTTASTFTANFVNSNHGGSMQAPVRGFADYYWNVNRIGSGADAAVQLSIPGALPGALVGYDIAVARYNGSNWISTKGTTGLVVSPGTSTSGIVRSAVLSAFGAITLSLESEAALPTYLVSFEARGGEKGTAELAWKITDNSTPETFEILRSSNGSDFSKIGAVSGVEGQYNYSFTDPSMLAGNNYYKLRMLDKDGSTTHSVVRMVIRNNDRTIVQSLMPTMVHDMTKLRVSAPMSTYMQIAVTDASGKIVIKQQINIQAGTQDIWMNMSKLKPGIYQVTGYAPGEKSVTLRFIKL